MFWFIRLDFLELVLCLIKANSAVRQNTCIEVHSLIACLFSIVTSVPLSFRLVFVRAGSLRTQHRSEHILQVCLCWVISFDFYSIHLIMKSSRFWGKILRFPYKSLDKSSDCVDFTKSMDLLDLSEHI